MKVSDITAAVSDLWAFVWPPVVLVILLVGIARVLAPETVRSVVTRLLEVSAQGATAIRPHLESFGLTKLIPLVALFMVIFTLYVVRVLVSSLGSIVPPTVSYRQDVMMATYLRDAELTCLWKRFPSDLAVHRVLEEIRQEEGASQGDYWSQKAGRDHARFGAVKFLAIWAVAMFFLEIVRGGLSISSVIRLVVLLALCAAALLAFLGLYLYGVQQQAYSDFGDIRHFLFQDEKCADAAVEPSREEKVHIEHLRSAPWWSFEVSGWRYARWMYENVVKRTANPLLQRTRDARR